MQIVTLAAQKGGVGKTTLAVNIAVAAQLGGTKTALFDLDGQESATAWSERRTAELPHVEPISVRRLRQAIEAARTNGFGLVILDTPPAAGAEAAAAAELSDLVLIPCGASLIDLDAIKRTAQLVATMGKAAYAILNAIPPTATALAEDARTLIEQAGLRVAPVIVRQRGAFRGSWPSGQGVAEYEPNGKAAEELANLLMFMFAELQDGKSPNMQRRAHG